MRTLEPQPRIIDLRGLCSPQPVLVLADEAERVGPGETFAVLSDDPRSPTEFLGWRLSAGMDLVEQKYLASGVDRYLFRRPPITAEGAADAGHRGTK
jgi:TusA-related sulfurtransferase